MLGAFFSAIGGGIAGERPQEDSKSLPKEKKSANSRQSEFHIGQRSGETWNRNGLGMEFCWCPPGQFVMGEKKTESRRDASEVGVTLTRGFWIGAYEVTQEEYEEIMDANPSAYSPMNLARSKNPHLDVSRFPVSGVSWINAMEFCRKFTAQERARGRLPGTWQFTLPTEAQWEFACRAGTRTQTAFGDVLAGDVANIDGTFPLGDAPHKPPRRMPTAVGTFWSNNWGLYDMHGNAAEWCLDQSHPVLLGGMDPVRNEGMRFHVMRNGVPKDTNVTMHVIRGGNWFSPGDKCRSASRSFAHTEVGHTTTGFRVVAVLTRR